MSERIAIHCDLIPAAFGHYSQAIKYGDNLYVSAIHPVDTKTGRLIGVDPKLQVETVFAHMATLLQYAGAQMTSIMMLRVYMTHFEDLKILEEAAKVQFYFVPPARTIIPVPWLPYGARIAIEGHAQIVPVKPQGGMLV